MPNIYNSWRTGIQLDNIYPVGSIYMSVNNTDPGTLFGGTWQAIAEGTFVMAAGNTYTSGSTGGKRDYIAADMPSHSHTRGTMEITGWFQMDPQNGYIRVHSVGGAFTRSGSGTQDVGVSGGAASQPIRADFTASNTWTGSTSVSGTNTTAEIVPPYLAVYMWQRIS